MQVVALRKESVDRNKNVSSGMPKCQVALRKESVDRNQQFRANFQGDPKSLSARRAWIEIKLLRRALQGEQVALRKESVDRNFDICKARAIVARSLSARRAWIEIPCLWL